jgi:lysophospholipase L1-like esterase
VKRLLAALLLAGCQAAPIQQEAAPPVERKSTTMPQTLHVVAIGDSLAYGAGDERGGGIARRLEHELQSRGVREVETVNLGVNGAQTSDLLARLRTRRTRDAVAAADAVVLSIGANDLFRSPHSREELLRAPLAVAERILGRIESIVGEIHGINPRARVLLLGGYNPVPSHEWAATIDQYLILWDDALRTRFAEDARVEVVPMRDIVTAERLSRHDNFHPGAEAYDEAARRIATLLLRELNAA